MEEHRDDVFSSMGEPTEDALRLIREATEFVSGLSEELEGKPTSEILPLEVSMIASVCMSQLYSVCPSIRHKFSRELMSVLVLLSASILKLQKHRVEKNIALDKMWDKEVRQ